MLHVTNGDSAVHRLRAAGATGDVLAWRDALHEGPVRRLDAAQLRAERARFSASRGWSDEATARAEMARRDERLAQALAGGEEIVLWFESDLYDVLQLAQILDRIPAGRARLVLVGVDEFVGVAELSDAELRGHMESPGAATEEHVAAARALWEAFRAPEPDGLHALTPGTVFADAAGRHLQQFPWRGSGLNRTEQALLHAIADGATPAEAFLAQQRLEERPFLGDAIAFEYLAVLPRGEEARAILAGEHEWSDRPERWLGGVHVPPGTSGPRYDPATRRVA